MGGDLAARNRAGDGARETTSDGERQRTHGRAEQQPGCAPAKRGDGGNRRRAGQLLFLHETSATTVSAGELGAILSLLYRDRQLNAWPIRAAFETRPKARRTCPNVREGFRSCSPVPSPSCSCLPPPWRITRAPTRAPSTSCLRRGR